MITLSTTNPETINNNRTNPKIVASLCNSEFNPQNLRMINIAENNSEIIVGYTQTQDYSDKYLFLDSSELINIDCSKLIVSKMINFDHIPQIMVDDADYDHMISASCLDGSTNLSFIIVMGSSNSSNTAMESGKDMLVSWIISQYITNFYDYCGSRNSIGLSNKIWHNGGSDCSGTGNDDASFIPKVSNSIRDYTPVRKSADAPQENGHLPHQNDVHEDANGNGNGNVNGNGNGVNAENGAAAMNDNVGVNENVNGGGGQGYNNNGAAVTLEIHRHDENHEFIEIIVSDIVVNECDSWMALAEAIYDIWKIAIGDGNGDGNGDGEEMAVGVDPTSCWPGSFTIFGRLVGRDFIDMDWRLHEWEDVRTQLNCVAVFAYEQE